MSELSSRATGAESARGTRPPEPGAAEPAAGDPPAAAEPAAGDPPAAEPVAAEPRAEAAAEAPSGIRRSGTSGLRRLRRDRGAGALIGVLCLLLGFAFAVQVRSTDTQQALSGAREEDLIGILDELSGQDERLRQQIGEQRAALDQLTGSDSQSAAALQEARQRAEAIGILNGTVAARGPGVQMTVRDPAGQVRVADLLDAVEELRGAGAETMQVNRIRVGVSTAVTGQPGSLQLDGRPLTAPYVFLVIGSPQNLQTAMNIPGGVAQRISGRGGSVDIAPSQDVVVDALRPMEAPQYASPQSGGR